MVNFESVKSGIGLQLMELFPDCAWYKEGVLRPKYPHFFVQQLEVYVHHDTPNRYWLDYFMSVRYREASEVEKEPRVLQKLDEVGLKLLYGLEKIEVEGKKIRVQNLRFEKLDGVLHCFFNVRIRVKKPQESVLMMKLNESIQIREG